MWLRVTPSWATISCVTHWTLHTGNEDEDEETFTHKETWWFRPEMMFPVSAADSKTFVPCFSNNNVSDEVFVLQWTSNLEFSRQQLGVLHCLSKVFRAETIQNPTQFEEMLSNISCLLHCNETWTMPFPRKWLKTVWNQAGGTVFMPQNPSHIQENLVASCGKVALSRYQHNKKGSVSSLPWCVVMYETTWHNSLAGKNARQKFTSSKVIKGTSAASCIHLN